MNTAEIRRLTGASPATVHGWIKRGELCPLPDTRLGMKRVPAYKFRVHDVLAFLGISEEEAQRRLAENPPRPRKPRK